MQRIRQWVLYPLFARRVNLLTLLMFRFATHVGIAMGVKPIVWPLAGWCFRNGCETHCLGRWPDGLTAMGVKPIV